MSDPKDKKPADRSAEPTSVGQQGGDKRSGRVAYDSRGNPIWEWQLETGVYSRDVSTQKLKKLDLGDLSIAETARHRKPEGLDEAGQGGKSTMSGGGFNPYDSSSQRGEGANPYDANPYDKGRSVGKKFGSTPPAPAPLKPTDLKKLEEWMKLKKNLQGRKDED